MTNAKEVAPAVKEVVNNDDHPGESGELLELVEIVVIDHLAVPTVKKLKAMQAKHQLK